MTTETTLTTSHLTTIDQHKGTHAATGLAIFELKDVRDEVGDYLSDRAFEAMDADDKAQFCEELASIHAAHVALESLPADQRETAKEYVADNQADDFEACVTIYRAAIKHATEEE